MSTTSDHHYDALDDFAGPGGWDEGARLIGLRLFGVDHDKAACQTAQAAGHARETADVTTHHSPEWARGRGHVSSPSCTLFSMAGSGVGRLVLDILADGIRDILRGQDPVTVRDRTREAIVPVALAEVKRANRKRKTPWEPEKVAEKARDDAKIAALVLEPARRIVELDPEWVALEQVPEVLPLWQVYKHELRTQGWSCFALVLNAADYGVPQTRRRAIFGAHRTRSIAPPPPTHAEHPQDADLFGDQLYGWVSMAQSLGWDEDVVLLSNYNTGGRTGERGERCASEPASTVTTKIDRARLVVDRRTNSKAAGGTMAPTVPVPVTRPAPTVTSKTGGQWVIRPDEKAPVYVNGNQPNAGRRSADEPAPTILFGHRSNDVRWVFDRPATTVVGSFKPEVIAAPGYRTQTSRQDAAGSVTVSVAEAGVLQSFPPDYRWHGSKSKQYEQVGNAIPPLLAAHVLSAVTGRPAPNVAAMPARDAAAGTQSAA